MFKVFIKQNKPNNRNFKFKIKRKFLYKESGNGILKLSRVRPRIALCKPCNRNTYYQCTSLTVIARWKFLNEPESCREGLIHALLSWFSIFPWNASIQVNETWTLLRTNLSLLKYLSAACTCELIFITIFQPTKGYGMSSSSWTFPCCWVHRYWSALLVVWWALQI